MNKTKVDAILIEMISPKVKEIEEKFSQGKGLTQEDINTLLLKSQYNHINHLDQKLDETVESVKALETKFTGLEGKFELSQLEMKADFEKRIGDLEIKFEKRMGQLETRFANLETKFEQSQVKMQQTIITTMKWYIGGAGVVLVLLKTLDLFVK